MTFNKLLMFIAGLMLVAISVTCEVFLFIDYANTQLDKILAGTTAAALVVCQFLFANLMLKKWQTNKKISASIALIVIILFGVSISGTAAFFESRFMNDTQTLTKESDSYQLNFALINDLQEQRKLLIESAETATTKNNTWYAGEQLKAATAISEKIENAINNLSKTKIETTNSGSTLATALGGKRWLLWVTLAALVDLCPVICFLSIPAKKHSDQYEKWLKESIITATEKTKTEASKLRSKNAGEIFDLTEKRKTVFNEIQTNEQAKPSKQHGNDQKPEQPANENENMKNLIENYLTVHNLNQREFCERFDIKEKHLSLTKNHEQRTAQNKETAPNSVYKQIYKIVTNNDSFHKEAVNP